MNKTEIRIQKSPWSSDIEMMIINGTSIVKDIIFEEVNPAAILSPTLIISNQKAQQLMDAFWMIGLRPTEGTGSAGSLAATERHLADMRTLVFKEMK